VKFENSILKTIVEKLKLRRMRFKVDPAISNLEDFDGNTSYEGYVLNENEGMLNILVIDPNNQVRQTNVFAKGLDVLSDNLDEFKRNLVRTIMNKVPTQALEQIQNAPTFEEVELLAKNNGATEDDIKNAYRKFNTESVVSEQGLVRRIVGKTADIAKDVLLGKDRQPGIKGATGIFGLGSRIGSTLSKLGTKGKGDFEFKKRSSIYHKDRPRSGQKFLINFKGHIITGTVGGDFISGKDRYIELKNVTAAPKMPDYEKISKILIDFGLSSQHANFYIYDGTNRLKDSFSGNLDYDIATKAWAADYKSTKTEPVKDEEPTGTKKEVSDKESVEQAKVTMSKKDIEDMENKLGHEEVKEKEGEKRRLFKIKGKDIYYDSNYNQQTPRTKP